MPDRRLWRAMAAPLLYAMLIVAGASAGQASPRHRGATPVAVATTPVPDNAACAAAIKAAAERFALPPHLLDAISLVESGRADPRTGRVAPWPWTIDIGGTGYFFPGKAEAIAAVQAAEAAGIRSIDVGCAQINLQQHPDAFASLDEAFDPAANARYAARFLQRLHLATADWPAAVAAYHSMTPDIGAQYVKRVAAVWPAILPGVGGAPAAAKADLVAQVDPQHVMTPEFRARLMRDAAERAARDARMGLRPGDAVTPPNAPTRLAAAHAPPSIVLAQRIPAEPRRAAQKWRSYTVITSPGAT